jgi:hypothetical protein
LYILEILFSRQFRAMKIDGEQTFPANMRQFTDSAEDCHPAKRAKGAALEKGRPHDVA